MKILPLLFVVAGVTAPLHAATVGYWRFEGNSTAFLADSSGNGHDLTNASAATQVTTPYPATIPGNGLSNGSAASFGGSGMLSTPDSAAYFTSTLSIEAFVTTTTTGATQSIAGQVSGTASPNRNFLLTINGSNQLSFIYGASSAVSTLTLSLNKAYYVGVTVDMSDLTAGGITFYLQNLTDGGPMQVLGAAHTGATALFNSSAAFTIGSTATPSSYWTGTIDEVRFSNTKLAGTDLLMPIPEPSALALAGLGLGAFGLRRRR